MSRPKSATPTPFVQTKVGVFVRQKAFLAAEARRLGFSESALVRMAVDLLQAKLAKDRRVAASLTTDAGA